MSCGKCAKNWQKPTDILLYGVPVGKDPQEIMDEINRQLKVEMVDYTPDKNQIHIDYANIKNPGLKRITWGN